MTGINLAAAVRGAVAEWLQATAPLERQNELGNPAKLSAVLGLAVQESISASGASLPAFRSGVMSSPFVHLKDVFDTSALSDTPTAFSPVPETLSTIAGRAAALAIHGALFLETVSYLTENDGALFVNLVAMPGAGEFADKSRSGMRGHTDGVSFPFNADDDPQDKRIAPSPDLVTLIGLRNPNDVPTRIMRLSDVIGRISSEHARELLKPQYDISS